MNPGGIVLAIVGVWAVCQVLAGEALERLRILPWGQAGTDSSGTTDTTTSSGAAPRASSTASSWLAKQTSTPLQTYSSTNQRPV